MLALRNYPPFSRNVVYARDVTCNQSKNQIAVKTRKKLKGSLIKVLKYG